ncbi:FecR domain-containing protein [Janthinobacterium psychrotolerans]|uniref:Transmembrane sensor n=1 Tax=Janthinobacterium psychrotolerans TaxID=1747903 RepID=A0A1A7BV81_9BURK|nr:FecR domain-containing protein [Janthinobacterium psychrotolerans]OBV37471.1 transmembrane sensor [Janthinobacterium psychrotolerans]
MSTLNQPAISEAVAQQAADWLTVLMSDEAGDAERRDWLRWRDAEPEHARAWAHIEAFAGRFGNLHQGAATQALAHVALPASGKRRQLLAWLGVAGGAGLLAAHGGAVDGARTVLADYRTATGERREVALRDGGVLTLNTASAVNVRFDGHHRLIELLAGEIMVASGHGAGSAGFGDDAPLLVATHEGRVRALGTRFAVRQRDGVSDVAVFESAVEISPADGVGAPLRLAAGHSATFTRLRPAAPQAIDAHLDAWSRGQMIVDDVTLGEFLADLSRYRPGLIHCAPEVAHLRLSGVFPLFDTERILNMLPNSLPVQVRSRTRYWVSVEPAP